MGSGFAYCGYWAWGDRGQRTESSRQVGNGLTLKVLRKHIKRLVNYAEAGDGKRMGRIPGTPYLILAVVLKDK